MTTFNEWAELKRSQFSKTQSEEVSTASEAREIITRTSITFVSDALTFQTRSKLLPRDYRLLSALHKMSNDSLEDYDTLQDYMAKFMASITIDSSMDVEFWKTFDEETGELQDAVYSVVEEIGSIKDSVRSFRKE